MVTLKELLQLVIDKNASDLHLVSGYAPMIRIDGDLLHLNQYGIANHEIVKALLSEVMSAEYLERLAVNKELDFSLPFSDRARFRVNAYTQRGSWAASFRGIPISIPAIDSLGLPPMIHTFSSLRQGFILVTGPTGHGKSTTLAAILNEINNTRPVHIVTIEDPIEFVFPKGQAVVSQREMGTDSHSWNVALKSVLREDPDVVLIGEMRDYETIASAITIAETGHLVFATLHTNSAAQTVDRIVDVFPDEQQDQVRLQLSGVLEAVFSQRLVPAVNGGRVVAYEMMVATSAIRTAIREGKTHQIDSIMQTSSEAGMNLLESTLATLVHEGKVSVETAQNYAVRPEQFSRMLHGVGKS